ncbi:MAG: SMP-30/gluconolactonase/LRE family protein [Planctomycetota bacterium]
MLRRTARLAFLLALPTAAVGEDATIRGVGRVVPLGVVDTGRGFLEGPAAGPDGALYFTDIPRSQILRLPTPAASPPGPVEVFAENSRHANGLMFNAAGEMVACEMDGRLVAWDTRAKTRRVLASSFDGIRFNAPNDLVIDRSGGVYFTDPRFRAPQPLPQGGQAVFYVPGGGEPRRLVRDLPAPNGILISPDERTLYVFPTDSPSLRAYEVKAPGELGAGRELCRLTDASGRGLRGADGATIDERGNLYVTCPLGVQVISPAGDKLGVIPCPEKPANATFVGNRLYVTARTSLYAYQLSVSGHRYPAGKAVAKE